MVAIEDFKIYLSGGKSDGDANNIPSSSLGGYRSAFMVRNGIPNNLFDEVAVKNAYNGYTDYRCVFLKNANLTEDILNLKLWIENKKVYEKIYFGVSIPNNNYVQLLQSSRDVPYGIQFYEAYTSNDKLTIQATFTKNTMVALWLKREIIDFTALKALPENETSYVVSRANDIILKNTSDLNFNFSWE